MRRPTEQAFRRRGSFGWRWLVVWGGLWLGGESLRAELVVLHVAPEGRERAVGSKEDPLGGIVAARRLLRSEEGRGVRELRLGPGVYRLAETWEVTLEDSLARADSGGLKIVGAGNGQTVLTGAWPLSAGWEPAPDLEAVWRVKVPVSWGEVRTVFQRGRVLPRARSRGFRQESSPPGDVPYRERRAIDRHYFYLPEEAVREIPDFGGAEIRVLPLYPWVMNLLPVTRFDRERRMGWSEVPATYPLVAPAFGWFPDGTLWVENVLSVLDEEGEWVFDASSRWLYLKTGGARPEAIEVARLTELLRVEGREDVWNYEDEVVENVEVSDITFTGGKRYAWEADKQGWGLQHDWEMYDRPSSLVRLRATQNCRILDCEFRDAGAGGLRMDLQAIGNEVRGCLFERLGGVGILLSGYGMGLKDVSKRNLVEDNRIREIGREWWHSPGIFVWQSGENRIRHNEVAHVPYSGIVVSGRTELHSNGEMESSWTARWDEVINYLETYGRDWKGREGLMHGRLNEVAWNDVHHVMEKLADGNGIYVSGTGRENWIHHNFVHDSDSPNMNPSIRCDDDQETTVIEDNVVARMVGEGIVVKGPNVIRHNLVYDLRRETVDGTPSQYQRGYLVLWSVQAAGSVIERNVFYGLDGGQSGLFDVPGAPSGLNGSQSEGNVWWNPANPDWVAEPLKKVRGAEKWHHVLDPLLRNPEADDFRLHPDSPARALEIEGWDISRVGPRPNKDGAK